MRPEKITTIALNKYPTAIVEGQRIRLYTSTSCYKCGSQILVIAAHGDDGWALKELRSSCKHFEDFEG